MLFQQTVPVMARVILRCASSIHNYFFNFFLNHRPDYLQTCGDVPRVGLYGTNGVQWVMLQSYTFFYYVCVKKLGKCPKSPDQLLRNHTGMDHGMCRAAFVPQMVQGFVPICFILFFVFFNRAAGWIIFKIDGDVGCLGVCSLSGHIFLLFFKENLKTCFQSIHMS